VLMSWIVETYGGGLVMLFWHPLFMNEDLS
jgi:hypothetical protein